MTQPYEPHAAGVLLRIRARAGGGRNSIDGVHDGRLKVRVTAAPERGKANRAIAALLADKIGVRTAVIELIAGATAPAKVFLIRGMSCGEVSSRLAEWLGEMPGDP